MPIIRVELFPGRTAETKRAYAEAVTDAFVRICGGSADGVQVVFTEVAKEDWAMGGKLCSELYPDRPKDDPAASGGR